MKKLMSLLLAAALILTTVGGLCISVSADETDIVVGDFSQGGLDSWSRSSGGTVATDNIVKRAGKASSMKWSGLGSKNYIYSPEFSASGKQLGDILSKNYINMWVYSASANNQKFNFLLYDKTSNDGTKGTSGGYIYTTFTANWSGWKLISWDISTIKLSNFNASKTNEDNTTTTVNAAENDSIQFALNIGGWNAKDVVAGTALYFDSVWCSAENPANISQTDEVTFSVANNATDISKSQKQYAFTANKAFAYGIDNLNDYTEVKINGTALTAGTDYTVQQEHNVLYVTLNSNLPDGASCSFGLKAGTPFANGSSLAAAFTSSFTAKSDFFMIGDFSQPGKSFIDNDYTDLTSAWKISGKPEYMVQNDEITMAEKDLSLKWELKEVESNGSTTVSNTRLCSPQIDNIGNALKYDKIGIWMYSAKANNQEINVILHNATQKNYTENKVGGNKLKVDWTGWRLVSIDINRNFATTPADTDKWALKLQASGWNVTALSDTLLYVDSIFLYNDGYFDIETNSDSDVILGDFSQNSNYGWSLENKGAYQISDEQKREDKESSLKWYDFNAGSTHFIKSPIFNESGKQLGDILNKKYINMWVYSAKETTQTFNMLFYDSTTGGYQSKTKIATDWSGWKLITWDISGLNFAKFDKNGNVAAKSDSIQFRLNSGGWGTSANADTIYYIDTVWASNEADGAAIVPSTIADGSDVSSATKAIGFTDFASNFTVGKDYSDKITVKCNDTDVAKSEYRVQQEGNSLYVVFTNGLMPGASYSVTMSAINMLNKSYSAKTVNFTTQAAHYDLTYRFGADGSMTALPEDGSVMANAKLTNATAADTTARIITAVYDKDGNLVTAGISESVTVEKGKSATLSKSVTAKSYAGCTVKCYVWQWDSLVPYSGEIGQLK